jgi:solute carrier family 25 protein 34/35
VDAFVCAALAACTATTMSNPAEVAKTRLQLQGELMRNGYQKIYSNTFDAIEKTFRAEGVRGIQRGLTAAYAYSTVLQMSILGLYEPFRQGFNSLVGWDISEKHLLTTLAAGTSTGVVGATLANPLFLVKARMQAYSPTLPVGTQRHYTSLLHALHSIYRQDGGLRGLFRGVPTAVVRTSMGTGFQMPSYFWMKYQLQSRGFEGLGVVVASSMFAGAVVCTTMQAADTTLTRLYNQPTLRLPNGTIRGALYTGPVDCFVKIVRTEGPLALYKGSLAHLLRIAPHVTIILTANEAITRTWQSWKM